MKDIAEGGQRSWKIHKIMVISGLSLPHSLKQDVVRPHLHSLVG
jgi:hypothetical protein